MFGIASYVKSLWESLLSALGLQNVSGGTLLLLGLDNAGKTTLLHRLRTGTIMNFPPTERPYCESFKVGKLQFAAWDLGGHEAVRHVWQDYVCESRAVLFLVDATESQRWEEVFEELDALIGEGIVTDLPIAILFNKCDLTEAHSSEVICKAMHYDELAKQHGDNLIQVFRISVLNGEGYQEAFRWIGRII